MRRFRPFHARVAQARHARRTQRGSVEVTVLVVLAGLLVIGGSLLDRLVSPTTRAQSNAAELFASGWSRAELNAPAAARPAWAAYRTCWVARESRPFMNTGDSLMAWAVHPEATPAESPAGSSPGIDTTADTADTAGLPGAQAPDPAFTAEDLFDLCHRQVAQARAQDPQEPVVRAQIQALLNDREKDVIAMAPRVPATPPSLPTPATVQTADNMPPGWD